MALSDFPEYTFLEKWLQEGKIYGDSRLFGDESGFVRFLKDDNYDNIRNVLSTHLEYFLENALFDYLGQGEEAIWFQEYLAMDKENIFEMLMVKSPDKQYDMLVKADNDIDGTLI